MATFKELLRASFKSEDTEEWLDVHFTRPIGLAFALLWIRLGIHPNAITVLSIFLGLGAGWMFYYPDWQHNLCGVALLMFANFCDSTDGQMARLTGQKTLVGRMLDGFSGDVWFAAIYIAIALRLMNDTVPGTDVRWGIWIWALVAVAGLCCHSPQSSLADYYRQIHLYFLRGKDHAELDNSSQQRAVYETYKAQKNRVGELFFYNYTRYCKSQERRTPAFQSFFALWRDRIVVRREGKATPDLEMRLNSVRQQLLDGSRPLMPMANLLTFNLRAIVVYVSCLTDLPWIYPLFEITVMNVLYVIMHRRHERLCGQLSKMLTAGER